MPIVIKGEWNMPEESAKPESFSVDAKCPNCHRGTLQRGTKKNDVVQVYCPDCGFTANKK